MFKVTCKVWNAETGKVDKLATYEARDRMEAIRWINMMRDWARDFRVDGQPI